MIDNESYEYITCNCGVWENLYILIFDPNDNYKHISTKIMNIGGQYIKSVALPDGEKILICAFNSGSSLKCFSYDIITNSTTSTTTLNTNCGSKPINLIMEYFYETQSFIAGCKQDGNTVYLSEFSNEMNYVNSFDTYDNDNMFHNAESVGRINIIFPQGGNKYSFFYNPKPSCGIHCPLVDNSILGLGSELSNLHDYPTTEPITVICNDPLYYNYERTACIDTITEGFYCNSTSDRTIDRCHQNCKKCDKGPTNNNNNHNCLTCSTSGTFYFDLGNCVTECSNGHFTYNGIEMCKCLTDTSCEYCSEESKIQNLCETCNTNYYPKKDDTNNNGTFIKCYNNYSISDGYYLNTDTSQYEPCHSNCLKCSGAPTDSDDNCITCRGGFSLIKNKQNIENCYSNCNNIILMKIMNIIASQVVPWVIN